MRMLSALILVAGLGLSAAGAAGAPLGADLRGALENPVELVQFGGGRYCEGLRRACENKDRRGETGEGNCRSIVLSAANAYHTATAFVVPV